jgi:hypothetical protein
VKILFPDFKQFVETVNRHLEAENSDDVSAGKVKLRLLLLSQRAVQLHLPLDEQVGQAGAGQHHHDSGHHLLQD